ncbi:MAG: winged helix-turn-helix transcriptional regulator [Candidatus Hydrogenedens sp.]|jgi:DNA-binding transcriptional ArsR family regulator|nr:winged helix-turn-helix transcriptional regulator [Candidatus Hydrogenedens sp.]
MKNFILQAKAVADESRARILMLLREEELCLCQLITLLDLAPSTVSRHMSMLVLADLVHARKEGRWKYYRLADAEPDTALSWVLDSLAESESVAHDQKRLQEVLAQDKKELCDRYGY